MCLARESSGFTGGGSQSTDFIAVSMLLGLRVNEESPCLGRGFLFFFSTSIIAVWGGGHARGKLFICG